MDCRKRKISLDTDIIRAKARSLYETFALEGGEEDGSADGDDENRDEPQPSTRAASDSSPQRGGFMASKGRFEKFKKFGLRRVPLYGEAASIDNEAARRYVKEEFPNIINEGGYLPEQVFNMDQTGLF